MKIITNYIDLSTSEKEDIINITESVRQNLKKTLLREGNVVIYVQGSTAGITTIECEEGLLNDLRGCFNNLVPRDVEYEHNKKWDDTNGYSHVRSSLIKTSLTIPFSRSELLLGTWQQIVFLEFDNRARDRKIVTQFIGE